MMPTRLNELPLLEKMVGEDLLEQTVNAAHDRHAVEHHLAIS